MRKIFLLIGFIFLFNINNVYAYNESVIDITEMDIFEIQEAIDNKLINYENLIKLYLDRIEEYNSQYNAIISINENIIEEAKNCDKEYESNGRKSILYCMPIVVKDNIDVVGLPTTVGTKSLNDSYPIEDAEVIKLLKEKGALIIGKANMSEFAFEAQSSTSSYGTVKNAYNLEYTSYGSSGGTAVAVATSTAALGIGTDTNMSVRAPSSANNLFGMRPTYSLLSNDGVVNYDITRDTVGPITKTSKENAVLLAVMEGKDENYYLENYKESTLNGKTIGVLSQFLEGSSSPYLKKTSDTVRDIFDKTIEKLEEAGATIVYIDDFYTTEYANIAYNTLSGWTMCYSFNNYITGTSSSIKSFYELANSYGHIYSLSEYLNRCSDNISITENYDNIKSNYLIGLENLFKNNSLDAIIYPTTNNKLSKITETTISTSADYIAPVLGVPSISIPMGSDNDGLYYGADLLSLKENEKVLYEIAYAYEQINTTYELPNISPNLYTISDEVQQLKEYYLENKDKLIIVKNEELKNTYNQKLNNIINFFMDYNNYEQKEVTATNLLNELKEVQKEIEENNKVTLKYLIILLLFVTIILNLKKSHKRKRY